MTECPPCDIPEIAHPVPPMWKSGIATRDTVSGAMSKTWSATSRIVEKLDAESMTPFGRPVVPEV